MYILGVVLQRSFDSPKATNYSLLFFQSLHIYIIIKPQVIRKLIVLKILNHQQLNLLIIQRLLHMSEFLITPFNPVWSHQQLIKITYSTSAGKLILNIAP